MILVELWGEVRNLLHDVISELAESAGREPDANRSRWETLASAHESVEVTRLVELPGIPRPGDQIFVQPFPEGLDVTALHWLPDAEPGQPRVRLVLAGADAATLDSDENRIEAVRKAGWTLD